MKKVICDKCGGSGFSLDDTEIELDDETLDALIEACTKNPSSSFVKTKDTLKICSTKFVRAKK